MSKLTVAGSRSSVTDFTLEIPPFLLICRALQICNHTPNNMHTVISEPDTAVAKLGWD